MEAARSFLEHFEKGILAGLALWLAVASFSVARASQDPTARARVDEKLARISAYMEDTAPPVVLKVDWATRLRRQLDPAAAPAIEDGFYPRWLAHRRPDVAFVAQAPLERTVFPRQEPPAIGALDAATRGRVSVAWTAGATKYLRIDAFTVERRELPERGAPAEWRVVAKVERAPSADAPAASFIDENVAAWTRYEYRVTQHAVLDEDDADVRRERPLFGAPSPPADAPATRAMDAPTPREVLVTVFGARLPDPTPARAGARPTVSLTVHRFDRRTQQFVADRTQFAVAEGSTIGGTGAEVRAIEVEEHPVLAPDGKPTGVRKSLAKVTLRWPGHAEPEVLLEGIAPEELKRAPRRN